MTMTDERLAELDAVMAKATARDWYTGDDAAHPANVRIRSNYRSHIAKVYAADMDDHDQAERDATAVVALHNAYPDLRAHIDAQAATIARVTGAAKSLLALCEQAGLADDLLAAVFPDSKNRSGQTRDETAKQARRTMNEARAALTGAA